MKFYHDFTALGIETEQKGGIYQPNQQTKAPILIGYLGLAIGALRENSQTPITTAELFCADAYYSHIARLLGADQCDAFDNDRDGHMAEAREALLRKQDDNIHLHAVDVLAIPEEYHASIVINAGGLYHLNEPWAALRRSFEMANRFLIVQTVVSLATNAADYFESPAPGWDWGCRFSHSFLELKITELGGKIIAQHKNELTGNTKPADRGSAYFLVAR